MFIVEGPDGAGKTTLIRRMQAELNFEIRPRACTSDNGIDVATLREWVEADLSRPVHDKGFYDRHPLISEPIYGPIIRGRMADGFSDWSWMAKMLSIFNHRQPVIVFCLPPKQIVLDNVRDTHEATTDHLSGVLQHCTALYEMYCFRTAQQSQHGDVIVWDYTTADDSDFKDLLSIASEVL